MAAGEQLPLAGVPFAVKDNIDVAGLPTTAACPAFAYAPPSRRARRRSGCSTPARCSIGKTNLDQFATGLVGVRAAPTARCAIASTTATTSAAARAPARRSRWPPAWSPSRSAPTPPAPAACRRRSTISSASSRPGALEHARRRAGLPLARLRHACSPAPRTMRRWSTSVAAGFDPADPYSRRRAAAAAAGAGRADSAWRAAAASSSNSSATASPQRLFEAGRSRVAALGGRAGRGRHRAAARRRPAALRRPLGRRAHRRGRGPAARAARRRSIRWCAPSSQGGVALTRRRRLPRPNTRCRRSQRAAEALWADDRRAAPAHDAHHLPDRARCWPSRWR